MRVDRRSQEPVVSVGMKGLTESVNEEIRGALSHHELIKVKLPAGPKEAKLVLSEAISRSNGATTISLTGRTLTLFRPKPADKTR